jgi:hypothetical protein
MISRIPDLALFTATFAGFLLVLEIGFRLGKWRGAGADAAATSHHEGLQSAIFALLGLLLGFSFAMAVARYDMRKALIIEEANAIGTAQLRTDFLSPPQRQAAADLIKSYVRARIAFYEAGADRGRLEAAVQDASHIQQRLWTIAVAAAGEDPRSVPVGLFVQSLNGMIDVSESRRAALDNKVPGPVVALLYALSAVAIGFVAYRSGLTGERRFATNAVFACLIALVLCVILDVDHPRLGLIRTGQDSLLRLKAQVDSPP